MRSSILILRKADGGNKLFGSSNSFTKSTLSDAPTATNARRRNRQQIMPMGWRGWRGGYVANFAFPSSALSCHQRG